MIASKGRPAGHVAEISPKRLLKAIEREIRAQEAAAKAAKTPLPGDSCPQDAPEAPGGYPDTP